ncbi:DUF2793 domain-containing protein, partial [Paraburkholderia aspalathi]|nr:DUF2793 domain-containing protein [Paraburkholderia aspalathi]
MAVRTLPGLGLRAFWGDGADGWGDDMDENIRIMSILTQLGVASFIDVPPVSPNDGSIYIVSGENNRNELAAFDNGAWLHIKPSAGWRAWVNDIGRFVTFDGQEWVADVVKKPIFIFASGQSNMAIILNEPTNDFEYAPNLNYWNFPGWENEIGTSFRKVLPTESSTAISFANRVAQENPGAEVFVVNISF